MKSQHSHDHNDALGIVTAARVLEDIRHALEAPSLKVSARCSPRVKEHIALVLGKRGWAPNPQIAPGFELDVNAMKNRICLTTQAGNIARAFYDLLKFQALFCMGKIDAAVLILPTKDAARRIGSNVANFDRVQRELGLFGVAITVPLLLISFE